MPFLLRVATLNLRHDADRWPERLPLVVAELARERPHAVALQEVWLPIDQAGLLARELNRACSTVGGEPCYVYRQQPKMGEEGLREAIAILTRLPAEDDAWLDLAGGSRVAQRVGLRLPGGRRLDLYNAHLHHTRGADGLRRDQACRLLAWIAAQPEASLSIVAGDLNALPGSPAMAALKTCFASAYELIHGQEPAYTFPTPLVRREDRWRGTLDYILVPLSAQVQFRVERAWLAFAQPAEGDAGLYPSDHYGLMAEIALPGDTGACDLRGSGL